MPGRAGDHSGQHRHMPEPECPGMLYSFSGTQVWTVEPLAELLFSHCVFVSLGLLGECSDAIVSLFIPFVVFAMHIFKDLHELWPQVLCLQNFIYCGCLIMAPL